MLFGILRTKLKAYEALTKALYKCKQTEALKILLDGFKEASILNPFHVCDITPDVQEFRRLEMKFQVRTYRVDDFCLGIDNKVLEGILRNYLTPQMYFDYFHTSRYTADTDFVILKDTLPRQPAYYVPRFISSKKTN